MCGEGRHIGGGCDEEYAKDEEENFRAAIPSLDIDPHNIVCSVELKLNILVFWQYYTWFDVA